MITERMLRPIGHIKVKDFQVNPLFSPKSLFLVKGRKISFYKENLLLNDNLKISIYILYIKKDTKITEKWE